MSDLTDFNIYDFSLRFDSNMRILHGILRPTQKEYNKIILFIGRSELNFFLAQNEYDIKFVKIKKNNVTLLVQFEIVYFTTVWNSRIKNCEKNYNIL